MADKRENLLGVHLARFLAEMSGLNGVALERFRELVTALNAALAEGHSCLEVSAADKVVLSKTGLVSKGLLTPLVLSGNALYLHRYYHYEKRLAGRIYKLAGEVDTAIDCKTYLDNAFGSAGDRVDYQKCAAELAVKKSLCIISGGPGTGKTTTVVRILGVLLQILGTACTIGLVAPTGKAAMRLRQSVRNSLASLPFPEEIKQAIPEQAATLHRLLGVRKFSPHFKHDHDNPLGCDIVVVDEASMVDLALMSKLVDALKPGARIILLGDKDQLASVESGAVLSDLIESLPGNTVILQKSYRFDRAIEALANAVNADKSDRAWALLEGREYENIGLLITPFDDYICQRYNRYMEAVRKLSRDDYASVFQLFNQFRVLCTTKSGRLGVDSVNSLVESYFGVSNYLSHGWYHGKPVMISRNDYSLDLYNGDIGICLVDPDDQNRLKVWFEKAEGDVKSYLPFRLPQHQSAFGMTVHKSQGSEFDEVLLVLPEEDNQVLSRELIYTGITRAKEKIRIKSSQEIFGLALSRKTRRSSGLAAMLQQYQGQSTE